MGPSHSPHHPLDLRLGGKSQFLARKDDRGVCFVHSAGSVGGPRGHQRLAMLLNLQRRADGRHRPDLLGLEIQHVFQGGYHETLSAVRKHQHDIFQCDRE